MTVRVLNMVFALLLSLVMVGSVPALAHVESRGVSVDLPAVAESVPTGTIEVAGLGDRDRFDFFPFFVDDFDERFFFEEFFEDEDRDEKRFERFDFDDRRFFFDEFDKDKEDKDDD